MKLTELPNQDLKSFEFAAFRWLVKRFARPSRRIIIGNYESTSIVAITINDFLIESAPDIITLAQRVQERGLK